MLRVAYNPSNPITLWDKEKAMADDETLTNKIYQELVEGQKTGGLDWTQFLAEYSGSKGALYNAIARFLRDIEPKVRELGEVQAKLDQRGLELDSLDQKVKETESRLAPLEDRGKTLDEEIGAIEAKLAEKSELLEHAGELGKLGFDIERLKQLQDALREIGAKQGLKGREAVARFFEDLKDYEAVLGADSLLKGLQNKIDTKKLEAKKWQAEAERAERQHRDLKEAIDAIQALLKRGVKTEQVVSWNGLVSKLGGPEVLQGKLEQYKSMSELLAAKKMEMEGCDKKVTGLSSQIKALSEQKAGIEEAIKALSSSGVKEITRVSDKATAAIKSLSSGGGMEITRVSDKAIAGLKPLLEEIRAETKRLADLKTEAGALDRELIYARYFTTGNEAVLKAFPKEVAVTFMERALTYCKLNKLNPEVRVPESLSRKYLSISSYTKFELLDLIAWAEAGMVEAGQ